MQKRSSGGCGSFLFLLFFVFLLLKLTHTIDWSWWWVLSPVWLPAALGIAAVVLLSVTGVSVYKIVGRVIRRRGTGPGAGPSGAPKADVLKGDVVEAEGSEVPSSPAGAPQTRTLPAAGAAPENAGCSTDSAVTEPGGPSI